MLKTKKPLKLNLGCGTVKVKDYVNIDAFSPVADVKADFIMLPYEDDSVDEIYSAHSLEHVPFGQTQIVLKEWKRVLRVGGLLRIVVPNMDWVAAIWLHGSDRNYARQVMFGNQQNPGEFHKNCWARNDLINDVATARFKVMDTAVRWTPEYSQESIILEALK